MSASASAATASGAAGSSSQHGGAKKQLPTIAGPPYFCASCGSILLLPAQGPITCNCCGFGATFEQLENRETTLRGKPRPSAARAAAMLLKGPDRPKRATVEENCPSCNFPEVEYYTMQMRSVDEGSTVFYECFECGHKWSHNN
jgi:DNA-directed RNA polymerase I subunit RPA12